MKIRLIVVLGCLWWVVPAPSVALTVEEILLLKENGVSENTIQMMLQSEVRSHAHAGSAAEGTMGVKTIARPDGRSAIVYSTGGADQNARTAEERLKEERAWEMLRHLIVDTRVTDDGRLRSED
jgi:hypothetical protein